MMRGIREAERRGLPRGAFAAVTVSFWQGAALVSWMPTIPDPLDDEQWIAMGCPSRPTLPRAARAALDVWERFERARYDGTILVLGAAHEAPMTDDLPW